MLRSHGWWFEPYETGLPKKQNFCFSQLIKHSFNFIVKILSLSLSWWKLDRTFTPTSSALLILKIKDGWKFRSLHYSDFGGKCEEHLFPLKRLYFSIFTNKSNWPFYLYDSHKKRKKKTLIINNPKINY